MNRNFIFVLILLVTLSVINAIPLQKRSSFEKCFPDVDSLTITISPDPLVAGKTESFDISGTLTSNDITDQTKLSITISDAQPFQDSICGGDGKPACPIKAGTQFSIKEGSVPVPNPLPETYSITVTIGDGTTIFACEGEVVSGTS